MQTLPAGPWTDKYMGLPYRDAGRSWQGVDCLGLYLLVLATEIGVRLPDCDVSYGRDAAAVMARFDAEIVSGRWVAVALGDGRAVKGAARCLDAVRMTGHVRLPGGGVMRGDVHLGLAIGDGRVLHIEAGNSPAVVPLDDPRLVKRVRGAYRPAMLHDRQSLPAA